MDIVACNRMVRPNNDATLNSRARTVRATKVFPFRPNPYCREVVSLHGHIEISPIRSSDRQWKTVGLEGVYFLNTPRVPLNVATLFHIIDVEHGGGLFRIS